MSQYFEAPAILIENSLPEFHTQSNRSPGLHLSSIVYDLVYTSDGYTPDPTLLTLGRTVEDALINAYQSHPIDNSYIRLPEMCFEGIYFTIDVHHTRVQRPVDFKYTARSGAGGCELNEAASDDHKINSDDYLGNWWQIGGYVVAMCGLGFPCQGGDLALVHSRGDYRGKLVAYRRWSRNFTLDDKRDIWRLITGHAVNFCSTCGVKWCKIDGHEPWVHERFKSEYTKEVLEL